MNAAADLLADWMVPILIVASNVLTLLFSTKIKDFLQGIPSDLRSDLSAAETATLSKIKAAQKAVIAEVTPAPAPVVKPAAPPVPAAPVVVGLTGPTGTV